MPEAGVERAYLRRWYSRSQSKSRSHAARSQLLIGRRVAASIDLSPYMHRAPCGFPEIGLIYITCENSAVVAVIDPRADERYHQFGLRRRPSPCDGPGTANACIRTMRKTPPSLS